MADIIDILSPLGGMDRRYGFQSQPPFTTPLAKDVWPHDVFENRDRCGSRPGLVKAFPTGVTGPVHLLANVRTIEGPASGTQTHFLREFDTRGSTRSPEWTSPVWLGRIQECNKDRDDFPQNNESYALEDASVVDAIGLIAPGLQQAPNVDNGAITQYTTEIRILGVLIQYPTGFQELNGIHGTYSLFLRMNDNTPNVLQDGIAVEWDYTSNRFRIIQYVSGTASSLADFSFVPGGFSGPKYLTAKIVNDTLTCTSNVAVTTVSIAAATAGKRTGFGISGPAQHSASGSIRDWRRVDFFRVDYTGSAPSPNRNVVVALGGTAAVSADLKFEDTPNTFAAPTGHTIPNAEGRQLQAAELLGKLYVVGENADLWVFDPTGSGTLTLAAASAGTIPSNCTAIAAWRTRICVVSQTDAGSPTGNGGPQNISMSKAGVPLNWSFAALPVGSAMKLNTTGIDTGKLGEPINCLIAHSNDYMLIGCLNSLHLLRGDPTYGGQLDRMSSSIGIVAPQAYARGPNGEIVILSNDGLYGIPPGFGGFPQSVSRERLPAELRDIDVKNYRVLMAYDVRNRGVFIGLTPIMGSGGKYFWLDWANRGFWLLEFDPSHEPTALVFRDADAAPDQKLLFGCRDGHIRAMNDAAFNDDGVPFLSELLMGPIALGGGGYFDGMLVEVVGQLAQGSSDVDCDLLIGTSAENAYKATPRRIGTLGSGKNRTFRPRLRGNACFFRLRGASPWALEMMTVVRERLGKQRL